MRQTHTNFGTKSKNVNYLVQSFQDFKRSVLLRIQQYYPDRANLFAPDSDGDIFLQLNSRVGDILKFQLNSSLNQSSIQTAVNNQSIFNIRKRNGFYNTGDSPAFGTVDIGYLVPNRAVTDGRITDSRYLPIIKRGSVIKINRSGVNYIVNNDVSFGSTAPDQTLRVYNRENYIVTKKNVLIYRGSFQQYVVTVDQNRSMGKFFRLRLPRKNVTMITGVQTGRQGVGNAFRDPNNTNHWYQYPFLAQRTINQAVNDDGVQKIVQIDTPYKYVVQYDSDGTTYLVFGPGRSFVSNARSVAAFNNIYAPISGYTGSRQQAISPQMFLFATSLGYSPGDTNNKVLKVKYVFGGGASTNVRANTNFSPADIICNNISARDLSNIVNTMQISNEDVIAGGMTSRNVDQAKQITKRYAATQSRIVNAADYRRRIKARPNIYGGNISVNTFKQNGVIKAYIANKTSDNQAAQALRPRVIRLNKSYLTLYLSRFAMLDQTFDINYRTIKNVIVNFQVSIYDDQSKSNVQNDIAVAILNMFKNGTVSFQIGQSVDFNNLMNGIKNQFRAVRFIGGVGVIDKVTGANLPVVNGILKAFDSKTMYNIQDQLLDITVTMI